MFTIPTKTALTAVVAGGLIFAVTPPAQAQPQVGVAEGVRCSFSSLTDPTIDNGEVQTAEIDGGPLVATTPGATISMRCTIQVGAANATHDGTDSCAVTVAPTPQATAVPPTLCSYLSPDGQSVYLCTEATIDGVTYYQDVDWSDSGTWTTSRAAFCDSAICCEQMPNPFCLTTLLLRNLLGGTTDPTGTGVILVGPDGDLYVSGIWLVDCHPFGNMLPEPIFPDPILCPVLVSLAPGIPGVVDIDDEGDVFILGTLFWNCPPYGS